MEYIQELKPMDLGELLNKTFQLVIQSFKKYLLIFFIFLIIEIPIFIITSALGENFFSILPNLFLNFIIIIQCCISYDLLIHTFLKKEWKFVKSFKCVIKKAGIIIGVNILSQLIITGGVLLLIIGAFVFKIFLIFIFHVILFEEVKVIKSIKRSFKLVSYSFWKILGTIIVLILTFLVIYFIFLLFFGLIAGISTVIFPDVFTQQFENIMQNPLILTLFIIYCVFFLFIFLFLLIFLSSAFFSFITLLYFNQKIKFENFGIETMTEDFIKKDSGIILDSSPELP